MEDLPPALDEALLRELKCPECKQYMVPPIKMCTNGHNICNKCRRGFQYCSATFCSASSLNIRNVALENIANSQKYPCDNRQSGCLELFSNQDIAKHHTVCLYRKFKCPFQLNRECSSKCKKNEMMNHLETAHPSRVVETSTLSSFVMEDFSFRSFKILHCFGELFVHYEQKRDGRYCCTVQPIGTSCEASKYKCEFTLRAANGIEQISNTFLVRGYSEDWETSFNSGKCLCLDVVTVNNFCVYDEFNLTVTLSTV